MNLVAEECKVKKHHPEWSNVSFLYGTSVYRFRRGKEEAWEGEKGVANRSRFTIQRSLDGLLTRHLGCQRKISRWRGIVTSRLRSVVRWRVRLVKWERSWRIGLRVRGVIVVFRRRKRRKNASTLSSRVYHDRGEGCDVLTVY